MHWYCSESTLYSICINKNKIILCSIKECFQIKLWSCHKTDTSNFYALRYNKSRPLKAYFALKKHNLGLEMTIFQ